MRYLSCLIILIIFIISRNIVDASYDNAILRAQARIAAMRMGYQENPFQLIRDGRLKIKTKAGTYEIFRLKPIQKKLLDMIEADWFAGRQIRYRILKARQEGVSTLIQAVIYVLTAFQTDQNALIIADDLKGSNYLFDMSKLYHEDLERTYPGIVPALEKSNEKGLKFKKTRSQVVIETGDNKEAGRKYTFRLVHISEAAFIEYIGLIMSGLMQSVPKLLRTIVILETTANGYGGYFCDEWHSPQDEYNIWQNIFFGWFEDPDYSMPFKNDEEEAALVKSLGSDYRFNEWEGEEIELMEKYGVSLAQLNWRRFVIKNDCRGDLDIFHQEYPSYPEQAFLVSGRPRFNVKILSKMKSISSPSPPKVVGYLEKAGENESGHTSGGFILASNPKGYTKIWEHPKPGRRYVIGGDVAEGKIKNESKKESDFSFLAVLDRRTLDVVATWHGRIDPDLLGLEAIKLGRYYNNALIGIERNNSGLTTLTRLKNENYPWIYQSLVVDQAYDQEQKQLGWLTTSKSKPLMIDDLACYIREMQGKINDIDILNECMTYVIEDDGKTNAQEGCHDDRVIGLAIAIQLCKVYYDIPDKPKEAKDIPGSFDFELAKMQEDDRRQNKVVV